jgi:hypothetical protein
MAGEFVSLVLDACDDCTTSETLVLTILAACANRDDGGRAFPSQAYIAYRARLAERQTRDVLHSVSAKRWAIPIAYANGGRGMATVYRLDLARMIERLASKDDPDLRKKAAAYCRVLSKLPGTLPPGFVERLLIKGGSPAPQKAAVVAEKAAVQRTKGGGPPPPNRKEPESYKPEVEPERGRASASAVDIQTLDQPRLIKVITTEPEKTPEQFEAERQRQRALVQERLKAAASAEPKGQP